MRLLIVILCFLALATTLSSQSPRDRRGVYETGYEAPHALGRIEEQMKRIGWTRAQLEREDPELVFDPAQEKLFVVAPQKTEKEGRLGLLVWVSPTDQGNCGGDWPEILAKRGFVFIGPHRAGNDRFVWDRIALALDAVRFATEHYDIDPERIFICGHSGGGRLASTLGLHWSDVFRGGIYCCGVNHFRKIRRPKGDGEWPARFRRPNGPQLGFARTRSRHVFVNGETDFNLAHSQAVADAWKKRERFQNVTQWVIEKQGHLHPVDAAWLDRCLEALEPSPAPVPRSESK